MIPPPVAVIVIVALVEGACAVAVSVSVLDVDPAAIVTGAQDALSHEGRPEADNDAADVNPPVLLNCTVAVVFAPAFTETVAGEMLN